MDKWRGSSKGSSSSSRSGRVQVAAFEDSLLPPTLRLKTTVANPPLLDKRKSVPGKKWSIDAFFKKVSSMLDAQTDSSSSEVTASSESQRRKLKGKPKGVTRSTGYAYQSPEHASCGLAMCDFVNANAAVMSHQDALQAGSQSRSSDGSLDGRRVKDRVKARVEAKRDQLCVGDSSMDESSNEEQYGRPIGNSAGQKESSGKRRSRASRTERYLKRIMCNGSSTNGLRLPNGQIAGSSVHEHSSSNLDARGSHTEQFRPIERVPPSHYAHNFTGTGIEDPYNSTYCANEVPKETLYSSQQHDDIGVNPLVQQTLQYFSEFDRNMAAATQHKSRKTYPQHSLRKDDVPSRTSTPPKPPSRDYRSRILVNGAALDKYQQMLRFVPPPVEQHYLENGFHASSRSALHSPNTEVRNINEGRLLAMPSTTHNYHGPRSPTMSPQKESLNAAVTSALYDRTQSPLLDMNKSKYLESQASPCFSPILQKADYENSNHVPQPARRSEGERRSSKNLEEALCELEAIYNSLQLGDEELLERAEKRTMEEFHYKGFTASPDIFENENTAARRKTWADSSLGNYKEEAEVPDRLKDDMAYRRMHPKERPSSVDGHSSLSSISYLMTSPIPSRRDMCYIDPKRKPRRKEPDVMLDDMVFRNLQYANNTLKVVDPQPPFGIPLGPIATAVDSDYLHTKASKAAERARSPYIPNPEPDLVADDLAFRNLRKDAQPSTSSSRQPSPNLLNPSGLTSPLALSFGLKKKRAVRSLSANLYGLVNKTNALLDDNSESTLNANSTFDDFFDEVPVKCISRRTSDPELVSAAWQKSTWESLDVNRNRNREQRSSRIAALPRRNDASDVDLSNRSCDESSLDERIEPHERLTFPDRDTECKTGSEKGSSYLSSTCSTPPPVLPRACVEPVSEQEISVYRKLCQDLENLVQLTKGIDAVPAPSEPPPPVPQKENATSSSSSEDDKKPEAEQETSPIKCEISTILENLRSLGERTGSSTSCSKEELKVEASKPIVADDMGFGKMTKDTCDPAAGKAAAPANEPKSNKIIGKEEEEEEEEGEEEEEELEEKERKDRLLDDNVFFRKVQLAKLSGDWKESTPNSNAVNQRRSSLADTDNSSHWEGAGTTLT